MARKGRGNIPAGKVQRAFYLPTELADALRVEAAKRNESQSAIVEKVLRRELGMMALTWQVVEDNAGGLHLAVFDGGRCIYYRYGYEQDNEDGLRSDLAALRQGVDPRDDGWDMPEDVDDPQRWYDELRVGQVNGGVIVADERGIYPGRMGRAAQRAFGADIDVDDYLTTYSDGRGQEYEALQLPWDVVEDILGHEHTGAAEEDQWLIQVLRAAGAPDWVTPDAEGWIDENGWGLIGPAIEGNA